jgi:hypothetical protein
MYEERRTGLWLCGEDITSIVLRSASWWRNICCTYDYRYVWFVTITIPSFFPRTWFIRVLVGFNHVGKTLINFITYCCVEYTSPWMGFEPTTLVVIGTDCTGSCKFNYHISLQAPIILQQYCFPHNYGNCYTHIMSLNNVLKKKQLHFQICY